jgi:hypothetical protein
MDLRIGCRLETGHRSESYIYIYIYYHGFVFRKRISQSNITSKAKPGDAISPFQATHMNDSMFIDDLLK